MRLVMSGNWLEHAGYFEVYDEVIEESCLAFWNVPHL
jgi:hypothetical protein